MKQQFNQSNLSEVRNLLNVSLSCLESGEIDRMAWRIADAGTNIKTYSALDPRFYAERKVSE